MLARATAISVMALLMSSLAASAHAEPFHTVDQNPLLIGFGQTEPFTARFADSGNTLFSTTLNWSSTAVIQRSSNESLVADAESREWRMSIEHSFSDQFALRVDLPYRTVNGGTLDGFIENWHSLFGLPKGDRPALPRNNFRIDYQRAGNAAAAITQDTSSIGDASIAVGYQFHKALRAATSIWLSIKLPTGDNNTLSSSGAFDTTLSVAHEQALSSRWSAFGQLSGTYLGTGRFLREQQQRTLWSGMAGFDYRYSSALTLTLQLDGHTAAFKDSALDLLGNAWILTMGGEYRFSKGWCAQLGVGEDVKVNASPDVNFILSLAKRWR